MVTDISGGSVDSQMTLVDLSLDSPTDIKVLACDCGNESA